MLRIVYCSLLLGLVITRQSRDAQILTTKEPLGESVHVIIRPVFLR